MFQQLWLAVVVGGMAMALAAGDNRKGGRDFDDIGSPALLHDEGHINTYLINIAPGMRMVCSSIETPTESLVKGMAIIWLGVVGEEGVKSDEGKSVFHCLFLGIKITF